MMSEAKSIARELGNLPQDEQWLQAEISRLNRNSIVPSTISKLSRVISPI